ncbi:probable acyl-[acyl-carrier-protein]--UDP-N-acetylglucosamine O-acyltransferase, mitochondrial isoform X2 [Dioscorea cayenensis subsp. rotundata]|uniref:Probable acyl-[acyl-carrier-protein]--UDP-N-acetylglucosamine O-acyltransferase, mitochondrial isoform X2 n=1 Tax=Dioscorea cayennensis subsp. rotundata TaxID=55577 RepID=A0AB40AVX8_DIOCR|nr:probable acyl-[acyl-carrier-protein]--UDP-N-acetylglucosamine O-acyltransferase, mitochondrial isoform X2 [Dioscorea cayenensis subsp. rotundata]
MLASRAARRFLSFSRFVSPSIPLRHLHQGAPRLDGNASIHPYAIIHPGAVLGKAVSVGPFCTVGSAARIGDGCELHPGCHVVGDTDGAIVGADLPGRTIIGRNNVIGHYAVIGVKCQDLKYKPGDECFLIVGDNNEIREYTSIHRSSKSTEKTVIGDNNLIMGSCHIAHDCKIGKNNIFANNTLLAGHVVVEDYTHTAGSIVIHQFCHIGSYCFIGGGSVIAQDVPKYMMVSGDRAELRGLNLEGLRRHGFSSMEVRSMRSAYKKIFMPNDTESDGIENRLSEVDKQKIRMMDATKKLAFNSCRLASSRLVVQLHLVKSVTVLLIYYRQCIDIFFPEIIVKLYCTL